MAYVRKRDRVAKEEKRTMDSMWWLPLLSKNGLKDAKKFGAEWAEMRKHVTPFEGFTNLPERTRPKRKKSRKTA